MASLLSIEALVIVPLLLAAVVASAGRPWRASAPLIALVGPLITLLAGFTYFSTNAADVGGPGATLYARGAVAATGSAPWFSVGDAILPIVWTIDGLAAAMLLAVGLVALCVVIFSVGYMHGDPGWARYFALLSLFTGSMNLLVIAASFTTLFIGWELVGACSFLLIGFWYRRPSAAAAATKAFLTTRVGDVGLLIGIAVLWATTGTTSYEGVMGSMAAVSTSALTAAAIGIAVGAIGKSAQFPLHAWLPDAMEGPTPVSALIHAATMVAAGVYLVARVWPLFEAAPAARMLLLTAGLVSALVAALIAFTQRDIKKVLAYSTVSQLGFMFVALGVGAWFAAIFHLLTHAAFKALLFLTSGSVIHGSGTQDIYEMGGLRKKMPFTFAAWTIGVLALSGAPGLAGFFSKDLVLESVWHVSPALGTLLFAASTITAFYCARTTRLVFFGTPANGSHAHESPVSMLAPLGILSTAAIAAGWGGALLAESLGQHHEPLALAISIAAVGLALLGGTAGWMLSGGREADERMSIWLNDIWLALNAALWWDVLVDRVIVRPVVGVSRTLWAVGDRLVADGAAEGSGRLTILLSRRFSGLQSGDAQSYALVITVGAVLMLVSSLWIGR